MLNVRLDLSFPHGYEVELVEDFPSGQEKVEHIYFPEAVETGGKDGLTLKITPHQGTSWLGTFAFGYASPKALTRVFSCPNELSLCVISSGQGYVVRVDDPYRWSQLQPYPIVEAYPIPAKRRIVFADFTTIAAYESAQMIWTTDQLSWDGLKITEVTPDYIKGFAWDSPQEREVEFFVNVETGLHEGGSRPKRM